MHTRFRFVAQPYPVSKIANHSALQVRFLGHALKIVDIKQETRRVVLFGAMCPVCSYIWSRSLRSQRCCIHEFEYLAPYHFWFSAPRIDCSSLENQIQLFPDLLMSELTFHRLVPGDKTLTSLSKRLLYSPVLSTQLYVYGLWSLFSLPSIVFMRVRC